MTSRQQRSGYCLFISYILFAVNFRHGFRCTGGASRSSDATDDFVETTCYSPRAHGRRRVCIYFFFLCCPRCGFGRGTALRSPAIVAFAEYVSSAPATGLPDGGREFAQWRPRPQKREPAGVHGRPSDA